MENHEEFNTDESADNEEDLYRHNFVSLPWDERNNRSKVGIISVLIAIFVVTMALVINNLAMHYRGYDINSGINFEIDCNLIKVDKYLFVARIHSLATNKMICVGVVLSPFKILANELCLKSGPILLRLGSIHDQRCKKGIYVDEVVTIAHNGSLTKTLVLLITKEYIGDCTRSIAVGSKLFMEHKVIIIGRPTRGEKTLSYQIADLDTENMTIPDITSTLDKDDIICVRVLDKCPVRVGDLLVQHDKLFGIASTSVQNRDQMKMACFAKISVIIKTLKDIDNSIVYH